MIVVAGAGNRRSGPYSPRRAARKVAHYGYGWPRHQHVHPYATAKQVHPQRPAVPSSPLGEYTEVRVMYQRS